MQVDTTVRSLIDFPYGESKIWCTTSKMVSAYFELGETDKRNHYTQINRERGYHDPVRLMQVFSSGEQRLVVPRMRLFECSCSVFRWKPCINKNESTIDKESMLRLSEEHPSYSCYLPEPVWETDFSSSSDEELSDEQRSEPSFSGEIDGLPLGVTLEGITVRDQVGVMRKCLTASSGKKQKKKRNQKKIDPAIKTYIHRMEENNRILKYFDTLVSVQASVVTGTLTDLCLIPQGLAQQDRIADTIIVEKVDFKCNVSTANTDIFNNVRMSLFWNRQLSSNPVSLAAVYQTPTTSPTFQTEFNFENKQLYKIMHDVQLKLVGTATNPTADSDELATSG